MPQLKNLIISTFPAAKAAKDELSE